jgi:hypothetical protein
MTILIESDQWAVRHARHIDKTRYAMDGLHVSPRGLAATDGKCLAVAEWLRFDVPKFKPFTISAPGVARLEAVFAHEGVLHLDPVKRTAYGEPLTLDEGHFPPFEDVLPAVDDLPRGEPIIPADFDRAARTLIAFGTRDMISAWEPTDLGLKVEHNGAENGTLTALLPVGDFTGARIGLNPAVLLKTIKAFGRRRGIRCHWPATENKPVVFTAPGFIALAMPALLS